MGGTEAYIGVFDSGVGGISVLRELVKLMPEEKYLYFGDSANAPYGSKTTPQVKALTMTAAEHLMGRGIKALVVACNTATAAAIAELRQRYPETIIVGIEPALKLAADQFPGGRIGIMATEVTLREEKLNNLLERFPCLRVERIGAPGLVELIESGNMDAPQTEALLRKILTPYIGKLDALVLGCTHYPFVKNTISKLLGQQVLLLDGGEGTARQVKKCLAAADLLRTGTGSVTFENSLDCQEILQLSQKLLQK